MQGALPLPWAPTAGDNCAAQLRAADRMVRCNTQRQRPAVRDGGNTRRHAVIVNGSQSTSRRGTLKKTADTGCCKRGDAKLVITDEGHTQHNEVGYVENVFIAHTNNTKIL